jgi:multisubunit Na+/H+ antiporter MnhB subunit
VLLNFRAYDTLLEVTVLLLALLGTRTLVTAGGSMGDPGPVLRALAMLLIPFLIVFAGYLLWAGAHEPGGAFQAGTLLAAGGVLSALAGYPWVIALPDSRLRALVLVGPAVFAGTGVGVMLAGRRFIEFSPDWAGTLILLIEAAAAVSIGMTLLAALHGVMGSVDRESP